MNPDEQFFAQHPDRQAHIRKPMMQQHIDKQRAVRWLDECEIQFMQLGPHNKDRRRIIAWRVPRDNPMYAEARSMVSGEPILQIPILLFADETVEDDDRVLLPLIHELMMQEARRST